MQGASGKSAARVPATWDPAVAAASQAATQACPPTSAAAPTFPSISPAFLVEFSMALMRDDCSEQLFSSMLLYRVCRAAATGAQQRHAAHALLSALLALLKHRLTQSSSHKATHTALATRSTQGSPAHRRQLELCQVHEQLSPVRPLNLVLVNGSACLCCALQSLHSPAPHRQRAVSTCAAQTAQTAHPHQHHGLKQRHSNTVAQPPAAGRCCCSHRGTAR